jgi:hypothetical protein
MPVHVVRTAHNFASRFGRITSGRTHEIQIYLCRLDKIFPTRKRKVAIGRAQRSYKVVLPSLYAALGKKSSMIRGWSQLRCDIKLSSEHINEIERHFVVQPLDVRFESARVKELQAESESTKIFRLGPGRERNYMEVTGVFAIEQQHVI